MNKPKPPTQLLRDLLNMSPPGEKIRIPQTQRETEAFRARLVESGIGDSDDWEYLDLIEMAVLSGKAEYDPETNEDSN